MVWPVREGRLVAMCLLLSCFLFLGFAVARGKPDINLYVTESQNTPESQSLTAAPSREVSSEASSADTAVDSLQAVAFTGSGLQAETGARQAVPEVRSVEESIASREVIGPDASHGSKPDECLVAAEMIAENGDSGALPICIPDLLTVINEYDVHDWQTVKGIGPALANRVVEYRKLKGGFDSIDELLDVSGIGPAKLSQIEAHLLAQCGW